MKEKLGVSREAVRNAIKASREYRAVCDETVSRTIDSAILKYKKERDVIKSVKTTLHQISGAFVTDSAVKAAGEIVDGWNADIVGFEDIVKADARRVMELHCSSLERMAFFVEMYDDIYSATGFRSVFDAGCGLNPFVLPFLPDYKNVEYYAVDINVNEIEVINRLLEKLGVKGRAYAGDILLKTPDIQADCAFLFKILPLFEQLEKGGALRAAFALNCRFLAITFPTRSLTGKNMGMFRTYSEFMRRTFEGKEFVFEKEYANEALFIISGKGM